MKNKELSNTQRFARILDEYFSMYENYARKKGINSKKLFVFMWLYHQKNGITQKNLAKRTYSTKQVINAIIKGLEEKGYIEFDENKEDKREKIIVLSEIGRKYVSDIVEPINKLEKDTMNIFDIEKQAMLIDLFGEYLDNLELIMKERGMI